MHSDILDERRRALLRALIGMPETGRFYLAGGTALSLQLRLRRSYDFNFFIESRFNSDALFACMKDRWPDIMAIHVDSDTCDVVIQGVQVSFMRYPYPLISSFAAGDPEFPGLKLAGIDDIAVMKLSAIGGRGSRKDFYDLYQIFRLCPGFSAEKLLEDARLKFGDSFDMTYMIAGLSYFDDAEGELLPETFVRADWEDIKRYLRKEQSRMFETEKKRYLDRMQDR